MSRRMAAACAARFGCGGVLLAVALTVSGCRLPGRPKADDVPVRPSEITQFDVLYSQNCQACHGVDGRRGVAVSLGNPAYVAYAGAANIQRITAQGITGSLMPAFARNYGGMLTDQQVAIIANGIVSHWGNPGALGGATPPPYDSTAKGDAGSGAKLYQADCLRCHAPGTGSILDPTYLALISDAGLRTLMVAGKPDEGMPDWRGYPGGPLSDQQLADLVAYLGSQRIATPGQPYPNEQGQPGSGGAGPAVGGQAPLEGNSATTQPSNGNAPKEATHE